MGFVRAICFVLWVILPCVLLVSSLEANKRSEKVFAHLVNQTTGEVDDELAELIWIHCGQELTLVKAAVGDLTSCYPEGTPKTTYNNDNKRIPKHVISAFDPQLQHRLLDCFRKHNIVLPDSGEEVRLDFWYDKYLEVLFSWLEAPRRKLADDYDYAETVSPSKGSSGTELSESSESVPKKLEANKENDNQKTIIIAVVVTAVVTFLIAALFFICCTKAFSSQTTENDEHHLLSLSDYSVGSSINYGGSKKEEKFGLSSSSNHNRKSSFDGDLSLYSFKDERPPTVAGENTPSVPILTLEEAFQLPTMRVGVLASGKTLNPPPGRVKPLRAEPPSSLKPSLSSGGLRPPQTPIPLSSIETSSGNAHAPPAPAIPGSRPPPPPMAPGSRPPPPPMAPGSRPPPPPMAPGPRAPRPPSIGPGSKGVRPPVGPKPPSGADDSSKTKLKPFFWDKVLANPDQSMVWDQLKTGSFQFNEEMIESLFGYTAVEKNKNEGKKESSSREPSQFIQIIDPKKAQNLSILLRALNVTTEEVCDALVEGNELPAELLQTLLKMAPTADEELKLRLFSGELSKLGPAERFLKALVDIPFSFQRMEALLFMCTLEEEVTTTKESFNTLEVACNELRNSRLFLKLLEAVLKTGNRMNDGTFRGSAQAFKLDTLLKLADVKGTDGKTTLLHFVVQEIIRSEGVRAGRVARESRSFSSVKTEDLMVEVSTDDNEEHYRELGLQKVLSVSSELENVKKAANIDADILTGTVAKLGHLLLKTREFLKSEMNNLEEESGFHEALKSFVESAEGTIMALLEEDKRIMALVKSTGDYFHGKAGKDEGLRLFQIVRDFLIILDKACKEVKNAPRPTKPQKKEVSTASSSSDANQPAAADPRQRIFPVIAERRMDHSSSDSDND